MTQSEEKRSFWRWLWEETLREGKSAVKDYFAIFQHPLLRPVGLILVLVPWSIIIGALIARLFWV